MAIWNMFSSMTCSLEGRVSDQSKATNESIKNKRNPSCTSVVNASSSKRSTCEKSYLLKPQTKAPVAIGHLKVWAAQKSEHEDAIADLHASNYQIDALEAIPRDHFCCTPCSAFSGMRVLESKGTDCHCLGTHACALAPENFHSN